MKNQAKELQYFLIGLIVIFLCCDVVNAQQTYLFESLDGDGIPIASSDNGATLLETKDKRYISFNGIHIELPDGAHIQNVNQAADPSSSLAIVGYEIDNNDVKTAYQWLLPQIETHAPPKSKWKRIVLDIANNSQATHLNASGTIVGQVLTSDAQETLFFLQDSNLNMPLSDDTYSKSIAHAINEYDDIVGYVVDALGFKQSYLYHNGSNQTFRHSLPYMQSEAWDINASLQIVGRTEIAPNQWVAYLYQNESMQTLGAEWTKQSIAMSINNQGSIVGQAENRQGESRAFIYANNIFSDLNEHVVNLPENTMLTKATSIDEQGVIVGEYQYTDGNDIIQTKAYFLYPENPNMFANEQQLACPPSSNSTIPCPTNFNQASQGILALDDDWLALSQHYNNQVHLLKRDGDTWYYHSTLIPDQVSQFGNALALHGTRLVVGAPKDAGVNPDEYKDVGAIYIFNYQPSSSTWQLDRKITPSDIANNLNFGSQLALYDNWIFTNPDYYYSKQNDTWTTHRIPLSLSSIKITDLNFYQNTLILRKDNSSRFYTLDVTSANLVKAPFGPGGCANSLHKNVITASTANRRASNPSYCYNTHITFVYENISDAWRLTAELPFSSVISSNGVTLVSPHGALNLYQKVQDRWLWQAQRKNIQPLQINQDTLVVMKEEYKPIQIFSIPHPQGADLQLNIKIPEAPAIIGTDIHYQATVNNKHTQREAWSASLAIKKSVSDQFLDHKSDKRCLLKSNILILCKLGTIAESSNQTLDIVLTHHALGEVHNQYTLQQSGTDPNLENNSVLVNTALHQAKITMDMIASQNKVNTDGTVNIDITLKNHEATAVVSSFLQLRFPSQVKFERDTCSAALQNCMQTHNTQASTTEQLLKYISESLAPNETRQLTIQLRFPTDGDYPIDLSLNTKNGESLDKQSVNIKVDSGIPSITIESPADGQIYTLVEQENLPLQWLTKNWTLNNNENSPHIDWELSNDSNKIAGDHILADQDTALPPLTPGQYSLSIALIDDNHQPTSYRHQIQFQVKRPAPVIDIISPAENTTVAITNNLPLIIDFSILHWNMSENGKHYRWQLGNTHPGEDFHLPLNLSTILTPTQLPSGAHQLKLQAIDEQGLEQGEAKTLNFEISYPIDLAVSINTEAQEIQLNQTIAGHIKISNISIHTPSENGSLNVTFPAGLSIEQVTTEGCEIQNDKQQIQCTIANLAANQQHIINFTAKAIAAGDWSITSQISSDQDSNPENNHAQISLSIYQPEIQNISLVNDQQLSLSGPAVFPVEFTVLNWPEQIEQALQWSLDDNPPTPISHQQLTDGKGQITLKNLAPGPHTLTFTFLVNETPSQPTHEITFTNAVVPQTVNPTTPCSAEPTPNKNNDVIVQFCNLQNGQYFIRQNHQAFQYQVKLRIQNWFADQKETAYRWYINDIEQGNAKTIEAITIDQLNDGHHQLKVNLFYLDGTPTDISTQADFMISNPTIQITAPGPDVYGSEFSTVSLAYTIEGWQWQDKGIIPHHIIINENEAIYKTDTKPFALKKLQKDNNIIEIRLVTPDGERTTISETTQFNYSNAVIIDTSAQTRKNSGAINPYYLFLLLLVISLRRDSKIRNSYSGRRKN